jgi:DNA-binding Lrp family transcriptional regulator
MHSLDRVDLQLLRALCVEPRSTFVALASRLGLSRNTVQARMARLEDSNAFLAFDRRVNPVALGHPLTAFIEVHLQQKRLAEIVAELKLIPEILQAHGMSGSADLLVLVVCTDADELFRVEAAVLACEGVVRTETALAMGELIPYRVTPLLDRVTRLRAPVAHPDRVVPEGGAREKVALEGVSLEGVSREGVAHEGTAHSGATRDDV